MTTSYIERLQQYDRIHAAHHQEIVDWLAIPSGSHVLDAGCGAGSTTAMFAAAVGALGRVVALDTGADQLTATREAIKATPNAAPTTYHECSLLEMPFADGEFDLVWCSRVVHHMPDQVVAARALKRVVKRGGRVVLREGGLSPHFLPFDVGLGAPGLEDRLRVLFDHWFVKHVRQETQAHVAYPFGWAQLLRDAGCVNVAAKSFLFEALPPFSTDLMAYGVTTLRQRLDDPEIAPHLSAEDKHAIEVLSDENSPHYLARRNDLHWLAVSSVYVGYAP